MTSMWAEKFELMKRILFISSNNKNGKKLRTTERNMNKENRTDGSDFKENEIPDLSL